jgi:hypothetical protein
MIGSPALMKLPLNKKILPIAIAVFITFLGALILLWPVIFPVKGFIFYGDFWAITELNLNTFIKNNLFTWSPNGSSAGYLAAPSYFIFSLIGQILGYQIEERVQILILAVLPTLSMYIAVKIFGDIYLKTTNPPWVGHYFLPTISSILYGLNYANSNITNPVGAAGLQYAYILLPITFALLAKYLHAGNVKYLLCLGVLSLFAAVSPLWFIFFFFMFLSYFLFLFLKRGTKITLVKRSFLAIVALFLVNAFWIMPTLSGYLLGASGPFSVYQPENRLSFSGMQSMYRLFDSLMFGHQTFDLFGLWFQNWTLLNFVIPVVVFSAMLLYRNKFVVYLTLMAIISTFLLKATNPPIGDFYYNLSMSLPYGVGAVLANYNTWAYIQAFSFFFLIVITLSAIIDKNNLSLSFLHKAIEHFKILDHRTKKILPTLIAVLLCALIFVAVLSGLYVDSQVYLPRYQPVDFPSPYYQINNWLNQQHGDGNVLWLPQGGAYIWKPYIIMNFPNSLSSKPALDENLVNLTEHSSNLGAALSLLGVKYVVFHGDSISNNTTLLSNILSQNHLKRVFSFTYVFNTSTGSASVPFIIFENDCYAGLVFLVNGTAEPLSDQSLRNATDQNVDSTVGNIYYKQESPVEWKISVNTSEPFAFILAQPYDNLWVANVNGFKVHSINHENVNLFIINEPLNGSITLSYELQQYLTYGFTVSAVSLISLAILCIPIGYKRQKIAKYLRTKRKKEKGAFS